MKGLLRSGGGGFVAACAVCGVLIAGLWAAAREGPSAQTARVAAPTPTATATAVEGRNRFGLGPFPTARAVTVRAVPARTPVARGAGWGLPRRRVAQPTPTGWELVVGVVRGGDATGARPAAAEDETEASPPTPTPARSER